MKTNVPFGYYVDHTVMIMSFIIDLKIKKRCFLCSHVIINACSQVFPWNLESSPSVDILAMALNGTKGDHLMAVLQRDHKQVQDCKLYEGRDHHHPHCLTE